MSDELERALEALRAGRVVGVPTDTVYGLVAALDVDGAPDRLFAVKRRPPTLDLPVLVADVGQALRLIRGISLNAHKLMARCWPGAVTIVLPRHPAVTAPLGASDRTIGVRCPDAELVRALCRGVGPLASTSANVHGAPACTTAAEVEAALGDEVALVLDGGTCAGAPSTVVDCTSPTVTVLRHGRVPWADIEAALR